MKREFGRKTQVIWADAQKIAEKLLTMRVNSRRSSKKKSKKRKNPFPSGRLKKKLSRIMPNLLKKNESSPKQKSQNK